MQDRRRVKANDKHWTVQRSQHNSVCLHKNITTDFSTNRVELFVYLWFDFVVAAVIGSRTAAIGGWHCTTTDVAHTICSILNNRPDIAAELEVWVSHKKSNAIFGLLCFTQLFSHLTIFSSQMDFPWPNITILFFLWTYRLKGQSYDTSCVGSHFDYNNLYYINLKVFFILSASLDIRVYQFRHHLRR